MTLFSITAKRNPGYNGPIIDTNWCILGYLDIHIFVAMATSEMLAFLWAKNESISCMKSLKAWQLPETVDSFSVPS